MTVNVIRVGSVGKCPLSELLQLANTLVGRELFAPVDDELQRPSSSRMDGALTAEEILRTVQHWRERSQVGAPIIAVTSSSILDLLQVDCITSPEGVAVVSDFYWRSTQGWFWHHRWLTNLLRIGIRMTSDSDCNQERCLLSTAAERSLLTQCGLCEQCQFKLLSGSGEISLDRAVEAFGWLANSLYVERDLSVMVTLDRNELLDINLYTVPVRFTRASLTAWSARQFPSAAEHSWAGSDAREVLERVLAHVGVGDPGLSERLLALAEASAEIDSLLYLTRKRHRDHSQHQAQVALAGLRLLSLNVQSGKRLSMRVAERMRDKYLTTCGDEVEMTESDVQFTWVVAALFHDVGYPLSHLMSVRSVLGTRGQEGQEHSDLYKIVCDHYGELFSPRCVELLERTLPEEPNRDPDAPIRFWNAVSRAIQDLLEPFIAKDAWPSAIWKLLEHPETVGGGGLNHGLLSALNVGYSLSEVRANVSRKTSFLLSEALSAIALHDSRLGHDLTIDFAFDPIGAILRLADEMHEWERATWADGKILYEGDEVLLVPVNRIGDQLVVGRHAELRFRFRDSSVLSESGWSHDEFVKGKTVLRSVRLPFQLSVQIEVPASLRGLGGEDGITPH